MVSLNAFLGSELGCIGHEASPDVGDPQEFMRAMKSHQR
ncbi:hypothetical protein BN2364_2532 [Alloalcanivorax xenomutans]|nr:hypothetical protein BN2364_2532 [Alloalcanivorax xenomutans]